MTFKRLTPISPSWEVAFFTSIQPVLVGEIGKTRPKVAEAMFGFFDEDEILDAFTSCCNQMTVSICENYEGQHGLCDASGKPCEEDFARVLGRALHRRMQADSELEEIAP